MKYRHGLHQFLRPTRQCTPNAIAAQPRPLLFSLPDFHRGVRRQIVGLKSNAVNELMAMAKALARGRGQPP